MFLTGDVAQLVDIYLPHKVLGLTLPLHEQAMATCGCNPSI